jgi:plasmid stabilization system protein ParE
MRLILHSKVYSDIDEIMTYYETVATSDLADEFYAELKFHMSKAAATPEAFAVRVRDLRRVNLQRFPYHFLFRIVDEGVRVLVIRHHKRHPAFGQRRR